MAPIRSSIARVTLPAKKTAISAENDPGHNILYTKRKAENSPQNKNVKRQFASDLTNDGKTAKVKNIVNNKNQKPLAKVIITDCENKIVDPLNASGRTSRTVKGVRLPGPFAGTKCNTSKPSVNDDPLPIAIGSNVHKSKLVAKTTNRTVVTRSSLVTKPTARKPLASNVKCEKKVAVKSTVQSTISFKENVQNNSENILKSTISEPAIVLPKLRLRPSKGEVDANVTQNETTVEVNQKEAKAETTHRRSLRSHLEKDEVTSTVPEVKKEELVDSIKPKRRSSNRLSLNRKSLTADKSAESGSLYISALEEITDNSIKLEAKVETNYYYEVSEFDKEFLHDPHQVSLYAMEIFEYLKQREENFVIRDYMPRQTNINSKMRAMLVDWMVEVQENFELNHETLYLSVKIVDMYLDKVKIAKESLQLVGAAALFLSCKYDERLSPLLEDFIYVCDGAYTQDHILAMEQSILKHINYELSFPISYSFLRRYARCARIQMPLLTLARFILELGLMDYNTVTLSDSKQAAAALYLSFKMVKHSEWTDSLVYYTGYKLNDFKDIVRLFNGILHKKPSDQLMTIRNKYSHELFFKVAETPLIDDADLNLDN